MAQLQIKTNTVLLHNVCQIKLAEKWAEENDSEIGQWIAQFGGPYRNTWYGLKSDLSEKDVERLEKKWKRMSTKGSGKLNEYIHFRYASRIAGDLGMYFEEAPANIDYGVAVDAIVINTNSKRMCYLQFSEKGKDDFFTKAIDGTNHLVKCLKGEEIKPFLESLV